MKNLLKLVVAAILVVPLLLLNNNNDVSAARFGYDYVNKQGVFAYKDVSEYLARVQGELEITYVSPEGVKSEPIIEPANENGFRYFNKNGTYTIRLLLPNGNTLGYSFYQTIYTNLPLQ